MSIVQIYDQTIPLVSGYSMRSLYITESLQKLGLLLKVVSSPIFFYKAHKEHYKGVDYFHAEVKGWPWIKRVPFLKEGFIIKSIKEEIDRHCSDEISAIDAHSSVINGIAGVQAAKKYKVPFLYEVRALWEDAAVDQGKTVEGSLRYNLTRNTETKILKQADHVTVICEGLKNDIIERGINPDKITVIPNGVDVENFSPEPKNQELIKQYGLEGCFVIGFVGTFFLFEGLELLVRAAKEIVAKEKNIRFLFVGSGHEAKALKKLTEELGLTEYVIFTDRVKHDEVNKFYSVIDVLVYPRSSRRITELVTPLKPLEAMALEKIVIASDVGGLKELVQDGYNGILFKAGDVQDLVEKCLHVYRHFDSMQKIGKQAREYVVKERNWFEICKRYLKIYQDLGVKI